MPKQYAFGVAKYVLFRLGFSSAICLAGMTNSTLC